MIPSDKQIRVRRVLVATLIANLGVAAAKVIIGLLSRSLAMVSDGIHSSLDATSNVIGLVSTAIAARPPDADHPYGHRRFETLASMLIGGVLMLTAWEIGKNSFQRLATGTQPEITPLSFAVMIVTIIVNLLVWYFERRAGRQLKSEFLQADAEHTRSDVFVSLTVLASLVAVKLGWGWVDAAAALGVVVFIVMAAWHIVKRSVDVLVDRAPLEPDEVRQIVEQIAGIEEVSRIRSRGANDDIHLDLGVRVAAPMTTSQSEAVAREVRGRLREAFDGLRDIQVTFMPLQETAPDYALIARAEGDSLGLGVHEVIPVNSDTGLTLDMHVEVKPEQTIGEAHALVTEFERRLYAAIPDLSRVVTHIEPAHPVESPLHFDGDANRLAEETLRIARTLHPTLHWHDLDIRLEPDGGYALSLHCHVDENMPLEEAHRIAEEVETKVRAQQPRVHRITIHTEPNREP
jgi:cation diffusion facilitator family transporter